MKGEWIFSSNRSERRHWTEASLKSALIRQVGKICTVLTWQRTGSIAVVINVAMTLWGNMKGKKDPTHMYT